MPRIEAIVNCPHKQCQFSATSYATYAERSVAAIRAAKAEATKRAAHTVDRHEGGQHSERLLRQQSRYKPYFK